MTDINMSWVERLHAPRYLWSQIAAHNPQRGLLCREEKSQQQLLTWHVETGDIQPLTPPVSYTLNATLSPDGEFVTYLTPHPTHPNVYQYVRVPYTGGTPQPIALTALMYASPHIEEAARARIGFTAVTPNGYIAQVWTPDSAKPLFSFESEVLAHGPFLSADGTISVIVTLHSADSETTHLEAYDIETGEKISQLEIPDTPLEAVKFAPVLGDSRLLVQAREGLLTRPLVWDVRNGMVDRLGFIQQNSDFHIWDWIDDSHLLLQDKTSETTCFLRSYDISQQEFTTLYVGHRGLIFASLLMDKRVLVGEDIIHSAYLSYSREMGRDGNVVIFKEHYGISLKRMNPSYHPVDFTTCAYWTPFPPQSQDAAQPEGKSAVFNIALQDTLPYVHITAWLGQDVTYIHHTIDLKNTSIEKYTPETTLYEARRALAPETGHLQPLLTAHNMAAALALLSLHHDPDLWIGGVMVRPILDWVHLYESVPPPEKALMRLWFGGSPTDVPEVWRAASPLRQKTPLKGPVKILYHPYDALTPIQHIQTYAANNPTVELIDISRDLVGPAHEQQERLITRMLQAGLPLLHGTF